MKVSATTASIASADSAAIVVGVFSDESPAGYAEELDQATDGLLTRLMEAEEFTGKPLQTLTLYAAQGLSTMCALLVGLGKRDEYDPKTALRSASTAAKALAKKELKQVTYFFPSEHTSESVCGAIMGCFGQDLYRAEPNLFPFAEIAWAGDDLDAKIGEGVTLGESVNLSRELVTRPASDIYPESFADRAETMASESGLQIEVWDQARLEKEKCGSLLAVARGSSREPRLVIMKHNGGETSQKPIALVGKGVTFDSGGLSLKPSESMKEMKCDMAGAATVVGAMNAIAKLNLPVNVVGLVGLVENMVSGDSYKLGDVLTARSGKTIEVLNTDAEGRLVLADVLDVAIEMGPTHVIDLATLTGACLVALGMDVAGMMSNDDEFCQQLVGMATEIGEPAWQLPMFKEFGEQIKSEVADIKNVGNGRWGGAITAAKFLEEFVGETPWVHIDIAGPAYFDSAKPWLDGGGSGAFVRTLVEFARRSTND